MEHDYIDRLTALRQDRDVGQKVITHVLGCTQSTVSKYELRQSRYDINDLTALCKFYNVSARPVPGRAGEPSPCGFFLLRRECRFFMKTAGYFQLTGRAGNLSLAYPPPPAPPAAGNAKKGLYKPAGMGYNRHCIWARSSAGRAHGSHP